MDRAGVVAEESGEVDVPFLENERLDPAKDGV